MSGILRAGIIGAGFITVRGHVPGYRAAGGVAIAALCDVNEERARAVAQDLGILSVYADYREMLEAEDLDIVSVCSPNCFHAQMTIDALSAGAHVLCEKPMALTYADACNMIEAARKADRSLTIGFHNRYRPEMAAAKALIDRGALGDIYYARASMLRRRGIPGYGSWFTNKDLAGGGALMDIGCHITDLALWFMGHPKPQAVVGSIYANFGPRGKGLGTWGSDRYPVGARFDVDDLATAFVRFENGATLAVEASWAGHGTDGQRLQIFGTEGGVEYNDKLFGAEHPVRFFCEDGDELLEEPIDVPEACRSAYECEVSDWVQRIRDGRPPLTTPEEAALVVLIVESIYRRPPAKRSSSPDRGGCGTDVESTVRGAGGLNQLPLPYGSGPITGFSGYYSCWQETYCSSHLYLEFHQYLPRSSSTERLLSLRLDRVLQRMFRLVMIPVLCPPFIYPTLCKTLIVDLLRVSLYNVIGIHGTATVHLG